MNGTHRNKKERGNDSEDDNHVDYSLSRPHRKYSTRPHSQHFTNPMKNGRCAAWFLSSKFHFSRQNGKAG
jgi:hypothetical protein